MEPWKWDSFQEAILHGWPRDGWQRPVRRELWGPERDCNHPIDRSELWAFTLGHIVPNCFRCHLRDRFVIMRVSSHNYSAAAKPSRCCGPLHRPLRQPPARPSLARARLDRASRIAPGAYKGRGVLASWRGPTEAGQVEVSERESGWPKSPLTFIVVFAPLSGVGLRRRATGTLQALGR